MSTRTSPSVSLFNSAFDISCSFAFFYNSDSVYHVSQTFVIQFVARKINCPDMIFIWIALHFMSQLWENRHLYMYMYFNPKAFYFFKLLILIRVQSIINIEIVSSGQLKTQPCICMYRFSLELSSHLGCHITLSSLTCTVHQCSLYHIESFNL